MPRVGHSAKVITLATLDLDSALLRIRGSDFHEFSMRSHFGSRGGAMLPLEHGIYGTAQMRRWI